MVPNRPLGASWGDLGGPSGDLGGVWSGLGPILERLFEQSDFRSIFLSFFLRFWSVLVAHRVPKGSHFGSQNGAKIDPKTGSKFKTEKVASGKRLGTILARFGGRPGSIFIDFLLVFILFPENPCFSCQEASKSDPGAKKTEKWSQKASQNDPKMDQKRCRNLSQKNGRFGSPSRGA